MTDDNNVTRRTVMGSLAAAVAGKATVGAASGDGSTNSDGGPNVKARTSGTQSQSVGDYANRAGRINTEGFNDALDDYSNGNISKSLFENVKQAWKNGTRVVDKEVIELSSNISSDDTLEKNPNDPNGDAVVYQVTANIFVSATLTIEDGVVMEFTQGSGLSFGSNAKLVAKDNTGETRFLTATNARPGWWNGIEFNSPDLENVLTNTIIEYGGRNQRGTLNFNGGSLQLTNCTMRRSDTYGMSLASGSELLDGSGTNTYSYNLEGAVWCRTSNVDSLSTDSTYTDNNGEYVFVESNSLNGDGADNETRTWNALEVPYRMGGNHNVSNVELDIEAGTDFEFTQQSGLTFESGARMLVEGTSSDTITFTGTEEKRGWWGGIYVTSTDIDNVISHAVLEYGGNSSENWSGTLEMATGAGTSAELELHDSTIRGSGEYGMYLGSDVTLTNTSNNTYTNNAEGAARVRTPEIHWLSDTSDFTGNDNDHVLVDARDVRSSRVDESGITWDAINVPYRMKGSHSISGTTLTINHGATFEFTETSQLNIQSGCTIDFVGIDSDAPEGEMADPITFTGTDKKRGWWDGVYIESTNNDNRMEQVILEYAGNNYSGGLEMATGAGDQAQLELFDCTIRENGSYGMYLGNKVDLTAGGNTYTANDQAPARVRTPEVHMLSANSDFTGNADDWVHVDSRDINSNRVGPSELIWDAINVPYQMDGSHGINDVKLTVNNGATFEFTESSNLNFNSGSTINVKGLDESGSEPQPDPITFTGSDAKRGWWSGIYVESTNTDNVMEEVIIEYAGRANSSFDGNLELATGAGDSAELTLKSCTLRQSEGFGLYAGNKTTLKGTQNNTYTSNKKGAARVRTTQMHMMSEFSDFTGNDNDYVYVNSRSINSNRVGPDSITWSAINVPFRMQGSTSHGVDSVELVVDPGTTLEFEEGGQLNFNTDSEMTVDGTDSDTITFTGTDQTRGWWDGIYVETQSIKNTMTHTVIEYGGTGVGSGSGLNGNLELATGAGDSAELTLENCTLQESGGYGLYLGKDAVLSMDSNTYTSNKEGAARIRTTQMHMVADTSDFTGNDNDYVYVNSRDINSNRVDPSSISWSAINVHFRMQGSTTHSVDSVALTVDPGTTLEFEEQGRLAFRSGAEMTLDGTSSDAITFTGDYKQARGYWDGIYIESDSVKNTMRHAEVRYAGRNLSGAVTLGTGAGDVGQLAPMENCTVEESGNNGLTVDKNSFINSDVCNVNTFQNNDGEDCFVES